jgi:hypothetical protein
MRIRHVITTLVILTVTGCASIGPQSVTTDRFDYNKAISDSWKEQTLLNIVKIRYIDMPVFVEVASIVSGYTLEGSISLAGGGFNTAENAMDGNFVNLGTSSTFTDRPTITYTPITGQQFNKSFMTPIPPSVILFLIQSGWSADLIFPLTVDSINGHRGRVSGGLNARPCDPEFTRVVQLLRKIQQSGAVGMRIVKGKDQEETTVMFFYRNNIPAEIRDALEEVSTLLGLKPGVPEIEVEFGLIPENDTEIVMLSRSLLQIMVELAANVEVPEDHMVEGRTLSSLSQDEGFAESQLIKINNSKERPQNAFVAVNYRDHWFYIDDRDLRSKRTFAFLMILFSVTETGGREGLPLVTIPAG